MQFSSLFAISEFTSCHANFALVKEIDSDRSAIFSDQTLLFWDQQSRMEHIFAEFLIGSLCVPFERSGKHICLSLVAHRKCNEARRAIQLELGWHRNLFEHKRHISCDLQ